MDRFGRYGGRHAVGERGGDRWTGLVDTEVGKQSDVATALSAGPWLDDSEAKEGWGGTSVEAGVGGNVEEAGVVFA